ncbi:MAG: penicillin-binding protein [Nitrospira bacterium HGW-Nitrospira-1]|nr:MAG: penicillin-binding protein [Nitrospira bacterium HGW-Nitrospira-1]
MSKLQQDIKKAESSVQTRKLISVLVLLGALAGMLGGLVYWMVSDLPKVNAIEEYVPVESSKVYSSDGRVMAEFYYERRTFIPHYQIPDHVKKAFIAVEDVRFYSHPGVDFIGIFRAMMHDIKTRSMAQGGSTITQQLAKMLFLKPEKSIVRKVKEAIISLMIERRYTKDEILGLYLNQTYFGTRAFGIEAAAQTYFGKPSNQLSVSEAALLASLPKAPSQYSPFRNPQKAKERRAAALGSMLRHKFITQEQYSRALAEPLPEAPHYRKYEAPYFVEILRQYLEQKYGPAIYTSGYNIYSTIDLNMQHIAEKALSDGVKNIEKREKPGVQASLVVIDIHTGQIKAMVGGFDFWQTQFNRATQALRQPGSAFKPFVYATAIETGMTSTSVINDAPISFKGARPGQIWSPKNYNGEYHGAVTLRTALAKSLNAATVRLANQVGVKNIIDTAQRLGIKSPLQPYLPLALGASDVTLLEMVQAYSVFAAGKKMELISYDRIENRDKIVLEEIYPKQTEALDEDIVKEMQILLGAVISEGTGTKAKELGRPVYGKTGTTNDFSDAWFVGFDERLAVGVWVGRDDHTPIGNKETGAMAALPIWMEFMKQVAADTSAAK